VTNRVFLVAGLAIALAIVPTLRMPALRAYDGGQPAEFSDEAEVAVANMKVFRTSMTTQDNALALSATPVAAFSPVTVTCPPRAPKGCTVSVLVSSQFWAVSAGAVARMILSVTGSAIAIEPDPIVNVDATTTGGIASTHTMQWMKTPVPAGSSETVDVALQVSSGAANAGYRTLTVVLYKN
jgi:hypothetical protein